MIDQQLQAKIIAVAKQEPKTVQQQFLKLMEEAGEAAQAYLAANRVSGNDYKNLDLADTKEELVDVLLVTVAMLVKLDCQPAELETLLQKKMQKWLEHQVY
ncbi:MazG-like family protein [Liquorilactobacillus sicerae]|uniref:MazG-like family protein n=1 Tax=Liquorilactobacillus sicerae TaxID=1416943 RepID=UPI0024806E8F|nr:MazG-like family protein [Liquorilactobacillus sicerae]